MKPLRSGSTRQASPGCDLYGCRGGQFCQLSAVDRPVLSMPGSELFPSDKSANPIAQPRLDRVSKVILDSHDLRCWYFCFSLSKIRCSTVKPYNMQPGSIHSRLACPGPVLANGCNPDHVVLKSVVPDRGHPYGLIKCPPKPSPR